MSELKGPVIIIDDKTEATDCLLNCFQSIGWSCLTADNLDNLQVFCTDPLNQPVVVPVPFETSTLNPSDINHLAVEKLREYDAISDGDLVLITKGDFVNVQGGTNTLKIVRVGDEIR